MEIRQQILAGSKTAPATSENSSIKHLPRFIPAPSLRNCEGGRLMRYTTRDCESAEATGVEPLVRGDRDTADEWCRGCGRLYDIKQPQGLRDETCQHRVVRWVDLFQGAARDVLGLWMGRNAIQGFTVSSFCCRPVPQRCEPETVIYG